MSKKWVSKSINGCHYFKETCFLCNNWILENELFYTVVVPVEIRKEFSINNFIAHKDEWDKFSKGLSDEELALKLINHKKPRKKPLTEEQINNIEIFKKVCYRYDFNKCVISKDKRFVRMRRNKSSFTIIYDIIYDRISYDTRANEGLFKGLHSKELVSKINNEFNEMRGIDIKDDFTVAGAINKAVECVNRLFKDK